MAVGRMPGSLGTHRPLPSLCPQPCQGRRGEEGRFLASLCLRSRHLPWPAQRSQRPDAFSFLHQRSRGRGCRPLEPLGCLPSAINFQGPPGRPQGQGQKESLLPKGWRGSSVPKPGRFQQEIHPASVSFVILSLKAHRTHRLLGSRSQKAARPGL